eukprot:4534805-Prorocentrum_lima.AAC.1
MTSSLVGSEMCIRDRSTPTRRTQPSPSERASTRSPHRGTGAGTRTGSTPVSYTHLTLPTICSV